MSQVNLHNHTEGSFLDGYASVVQSAAQAKECGHEYLVITDHGECNQHLSGAKAAAAAGLGFIPGMEGYWLTPERVQASHDTGTYPRPSHICLLAASNVGLRNLWALSSISYRRPYFYHKPIASPDLLREYSEDIYASDGCMSTDFAEAVEADREDEARQLLATLLDIYGDRFYIELHTWQYMKEDHDTASMSVEMAASDPRLLAARASAQSHIHLNRQMTKLNHAKHRFAQELGVPFVIVNDSHHARSEDWENKELLWAFTTTHNDDQLYEALGDAAQKADHIMSESELDYWMDRHGFPTSVTEEGVRNAYDIARTCKVEFAPTLKMPQMAGSATEDLTNLIDACETGFKRYVTDEGLDEARYYARLEDELRLIADKQFAGYFNLVRDYTTAFRTGEWSRHVRSNPRSPREPQLLGPGRGSVGGSLVAYLTGIDIIDPIKYGTLFSRFLSPGRKGLPDIDVDVPQSQRKEMLGYFPKRYGEDRVCAIGTLTRNAPKGTLRDVARALGLTKDFEGKSDVNAISEHIADVERMRDPTNHDEAELTWEELIDRKGGELAKWKAKYPRLFEKMQDMFGLVRQSSVHAAGILVVDASTPLLGAIPMRTRKHDTADEVTTTQLDMWEVEKLGGVKLDMLGIRHLDTLSHARQLIYERHGVWIDYDRTGLSVPEGCTEVLTFADEHFTDPAIWPQIDAGQTTGIFQIETPNCTEAAVEFKPRSERDVADLSSIVRPGVADAGLKEVYLKRRAGAPVYYDHPLMEDIVGPGWSTDTYGVLVYQEQIIEAVQLLAGFTADEADDLRKHLGKKEMAKLQALKQKFLDGCLGNLDFVRHWHDEPWATLDPKTRDTCLKVANKIWESIEAAGRYAFNWSHAVGYAIISTWEIWTKHYYPQELLVALMQTDPSNINRYIREARRRDITMLPPDVNLSARKFIIEGSAIRHGLDTIDKVGEKSTADILRHRPYVSLDDYLARSERGNNKTVVTNLIHIGAFDSLGTRDELLGRLERQRILDDVAPKKLATLTEEQKDAIWEDKRVRLAHKYRIERPDFSNPETVYEIEKALVGTYVTVDPMERYLGSLQEARAIDDPLDMLHYPTDSYFVIGGQIAEVTRTVTKKGFRPGREMGHMKIAWNDAEFRVVVFPEAWLNCSILLEPGKPVAAEVKKLDSGCCLERIWRLDLLFQQAGIA